MSASKWVSGDVMEHILAACTWENELALRLSMSYGLRIGDVLRMPATVLRTGRWSLREEKTGKRRYLRLSDTFIRELRGIAGKVYVFEHRTDWRRHRTRQAVYKDLKRAADLFRIKGISPHSARKIYAVNAFHASHDLKKVQRLLNHDSEAVTILYALADELARTRRRGRERGSAPQMRDRAAGTPEG